MPDESTALARFQLDLREFWHCRSRPSFAVCYRRACERARERGETPPSYSTAMRHFKQRAEVVRHA
jgi:hypothetical protein